MKNQLYKTVFLTLLGVGCFVGGMYYATEKFDEGLDRVMDEYEVISDKVDVFTKVSDPKTIRLYVRELNKILDDINFLHRLIESGQLADEALTDMLDVQNNIVSKMDSLYSELSLSIISVNEYKNEEVNRYNEEFIGEIIEDFDDWDAKTNYTRDDFAVLEIVNDILKNYDRFNIYNKKQLYVYIREATDLPSRKITKSLKKIKSDYFVVREEFVG